MSIALLFAGSVAGQYLDTRWLGGYETFADPPFGGNKTLFASGSQGTSILEYRDMYFSSTIACISNEVDSPVAYTNGIYLANIANDTMLNGTDLNPSNYTDQTYGCYTANSHILLPWPGGADSLALFHMATDTFNTSFTYVSRHLYMSVIDMTGDGGLGEVVNKNQILQVGEFCTGGVSACRHGNGRDWWILFHRCTSDEFIEFLLTPAGVVGPWYQTIGEQRLGSVPSGVFSPDGSHFAYVDAFSNVDVFDFDRCSGLLSNVRHADIDSSNYAAFAAYSPNGRFLYVTWVGRVYQYDTYAADLESSRVTVAVWDSTYDPVPPFAMLFLNIGLAPDGKIYMSTGNSSHFMHIIDQPDSLGLACNAQLHAHNRQTYTDNSIPYRPNYYIGPLAGSPCDTLGIGVPEHPPPLHISAFPNPSAGNFTLTYPAQSAVGQLEIRDLSGRIVLWERLPQWSSLHEVDLRSRAAGMYQCTLHWGQRTANVRIIIQP